MALFDILTRPSLNITKDQEQEVKATGRDQLETLKREKLVLDWRKRQQSRSKVRVAMETKLDKKLPRVYDTDLFNQKCAAVYTHIYDAYFGAGKSKYAMSA